MRGFEEGLAFYILHQWASQPIYTYEDLYEEAAEVEQVKSALGVMNPNLSHQQRKWAEQGGPSESVHQNVKKPPPLPLRVVPLVQQSLVENLGEQTTLVLNVEWDQQLFVMWQHRTLYRCLSSTSKDYQSWSNKTPHLVMGQYLPFNKDHPSRTIKGLHLHLVKGLHLQRIHLQEEPM